MEFEQFVLAHEPTIRLVFFLGTFAMVAFYSARIWARAVAGIQASAG